MKSLLSILSLLIIFSFSLNANEILSFSGSISVSESGNITLHQNYPNPAKGSTIIKYTIPVGEKGVFKLYNMTGTVIQSIELNSSENSVRLSVDNLSDGIYLYSLETSSGEKITRKMTVRNN